jgi:peptide/nickel transport system ATP-binding protein
MPEADMAGSGDAHLRPRGIDVLLRVEHLVKQYVGHRGAIVHAVSNVSFDIMRGETLGLVGESGCGKTSVGRSVLQLPPPSSGRILFDGHDLTVLQGEALRSRRPGLQMVFQDPISSLNPRRRIGEIVAAPLLVNGDMSVEARDRRVREVLEAVGLDATAVWSLRPHELSGGQCQRVSLARALVLNPKLIVCDEPVSSLDVSVQAQILNLLEDTKERFGLTMLFIAHDLAVVKNISDRIAVMYLGKLCEVAPAAELYARPRHPYTGALIASIPVPDPRARRLHGVAIKGDPPSPLDPPSGCRFRTRCPHAAEVCAAKEPVMREVAAGHFVACHIPLA